MGKFQATKRLVRDYFDELEAASPDQVEAVLRKYMSDDYDWKACFPFRNLKGIHQVAEEFWKPLKTSLSRMQRRQDIFIAGVNELGAEHGESGDEQWVMSMGNLLGNFEKDWIGIRRTHNIKMLRYAEFICVKDGKITKTGFFFDLLGFMVQAGVSPLPKQAASIFVYPGPREHDGLLFEDAPEEERKLTSDLVLRMCSAIGSNYDTMDGHPVSVLSRTWSDDMLWMGSGGSSYTIEAFQRSQEEFRGRMRDKNFNGHLCRFGEGNFYCFFGWPNLVNTPLGGIYGLPGGQVPAEMQVVDVYNRRGDKLTENWVFVDIPYWLSQQGLDVLENNRKVNNPD